MSRIGRMPIAVPAGVTVEIAENNHVTCPYLLYFDIRLIVI